MAGDVISLFLCGDVMTGRGIDQVLPYPSDPVLYEPSAKSAQDYVALAERKNGPIESPVGFAYVWGDALAALASNRPDVRIVNLETSVTVSDDAMPKGINYRMNPRNVPCLTAADITCCTLANNHVLDWGQAGLIETLEALASAEISVAGAGRDIEQARAPAVLDMPGRGRVLVFAFGTASSGIPRTWAAADGKPGVDLLPDLSERTVTRIATAIRQTRRDGDIVIASVHWGGNWGYDIPSPQRDFAHALIDDAGVDVLHGHSSHHAKAMEVYRSRPILYGCGDFLTDYEGIMGYEQFRDDLVLAYLLQVDGSSGELRELKMIPFQLRRFQLKRASDRDVQWIWAKLDGEARRFGGQLERMADDSLVLRWREE